MTEKKSSPESSERSYPKFFEKGIPIAIGLITLISIGMFILAIGIALGYFQGT